MNNCVICLWNERRITPAVHDKRICQRHLDEAIAALQAVDAPTVEARRTRRLRRQREAVAR